MTLAVTLGRVTPTGPLHIAAHDIELVPCPTEPRDLEHDDLPAIAHPLATVSLDLPGAPAFLALLDALAAAHPHPDHLCTSCLPPDLITAYRFLPIRLSQAACQALAREFARVRFTEDTTDTPPPEPDADGYRFVSLSYHARSAIAGLIAPRGDKPGEVWHDGIVIDAWDEIAAAFPRTLARGRRSRQKELAAAFPLHWFTSWAELHPYDPEHDDDQINYYDPEAGL